MQSTQTDDVLIMCGNAQTWCTADGRRDPALDRLRGTQHYDQRIEDMRLSRKRNG